MKAQLPLTGGTLRLAMLGMVDGNGHPYSWSAIFNGYEREAMSRCPFAAIPNYLFREPEETLRIPGAQVTHIWTDDPADAELVARASRIPHVVERPEDIIGQVDAVIVATDKGWEHVWRCRPFVEAGLPVFVDKPLADNDADLATFRDWVAGGAAILSSSCMRYSKEFMPWRVSTHDLGQLRLASVTMAKSWERYGIHALEAIYPILGPGFTAVRYSGDTQRGIVHLEHSRGAEGVISIISDLYGGFGCLTLAGTEGSVSVKNNDTFYSFKTQLESYIKYLRTGVRPFDFSETVEMMRIIIAGLRSREAGGARVAL